MLAQAPLAPQIPMQMSPPRIRAQVPATQLSTASPHKSRAAAQAASRMLPLGLSPPRGRQQVASLVPQSQLPPPVPSQLMAQQPLSQSFTTQHRVAPPTHQQVAPGTLRTPGTLQVTPQLSATAQMPPSPQAPSPQAQQSAQVQPSPPTQLQQQVSQVQQQQLTQAQPQATQVQQQVTQVQQQTAHMQQQTSQVQQPTTQVQQQVTQGQQLSVQPQQQSAHIQQDLPGQQQSTQGSDGKTKVPPLQSISLTKPPVELPPQLIAEYEADNELLGEGAFAVVRRLRHRRTGDAVALKVIEKYPLHIRNMLSQLQREVRIQGNLQHRHILRLISCLEDDSYVYMVLENCAGGSLRSLCAQQPAYRLPEARAARYFAQILQGTEFMHQHLCVHRDLKPENMLLTDEDEVRICDFGWSAEVQIEQALRTTCGTPHYWAPEIFEGSPQDVAVDLWALGTLVYEVLVGHAPFWGNMEELRRKVLAVDLRYPPGVLSNEAIKLFYCLLQKDPRNRIPAGRLLDHPWVRTAMNACTTSNAQSGVASPLTSIQPQQGDTVADTSATAGSPKLPTSTTNIASQPTTGSSIVVSTTTIASHTPGPMTPVAPTPEAPATGGAEPSPVITTMEVPAVANATASNTSPTSVPSTTASVVPTATPVVAPAVRLGATTTRRTAKVLSAALPPQLTSAATGSTSTTVTPIGPSVAAAATVAVPPGTTPATHPPAPALASAIFSRSSTTSSSASPSSSAAVATERPRAIATAVNAPASATPAVLPPMSEAAGSTSGDRQGSVVPAIVVDSVPTPTVERNTKVVARVVARAVGSGATELYPPNTEVVQDSRGT